MSCRSTFLAIAMLGALLAPLPCSAQDAGVSGIPPGPGSVGGLNNSGTDPSGRRNAPQAPPPPSMTVPAVPSAPAASGGISQRAAPVVRIQRRSAAALRRDARRNSNHAARRGRERLLDRKLDRTLNICRGC
ncbi:hypothetical protein [uncultured Bradyrhizobium sp.]|uniref:hypothetical protein n=1 Tax=uncultured Bradyrhizobium sp. TaxID=199684 RepID=UPI0035CA8E31